MKLGVLIISAFLAVSANAFPNSPLDAIGTVGQFAGMASQGMNMAQNLMKPAELVTTNLGAVSSGISQVLGHGLGSDSGSDKGAGFPLSLLSSQNLPSDDVKSSMNFDGICKALNGVTSVPEAIDKIRGVFLDRGLPFNFKEVLDVVTSTLGEMKLGGGLDPSSILKIFESIGLPNQLLGVDPVDLEELSSQLAVIFNEVLDNVLEKITRFREIGNLDNVEDLFWDIFENLYRIVVDKLLVSENGALKKLAVIIENVPGSGEGASGLLEEQPWPSLVKMVHGKIDHLKTLPKLDHPIISRKKHLSHNPKLTAQASANAEVVNTKPQNQKDCNDSQGNDEESFVNSPASKSGIETIVDPDKRKDTSNLLQDYLAKHGPDKFNANKPTDDNKPANILRRHDSPKSHRHLDDQESLVPTDDHIIHDILRHRLRLGHIRRRGESPIDHPRASNNSPIGKYSPDKSGKQPLPPNLQNSPENNNRQPSLDSNGSGDIEKAEAKAKVSNEQSNQDQLDQIETNDSQPNDDVETVVSANESSQAATSPDTSEVKAQSSASAEITIKTEPQPNQEDDNNNRPFDDSEKTPENSAASGTEDIKPNNNNMLNPRIGTIKHPNNRKDESDILQGIPENINSNNPHNKNKPTINKLPNFLRRHDIPRHNIPLSNGPWDQATNGLPTYDTHPRHHLRPSQLNRHDNTRSIDTNSPLVKTTSQPEAKQPTLHQTHHPRYRNTERKPHVISNGLANFKDDNPKLLTEPQIGTKPQNPNGNTRPKNVNSKPQSDTSDISENDSYEPQDDEYSAEQTGQQPLTSNLQNARPLSSASGEKPSEGYSIPSKPKHRPRKTRVILKSLANSKANTPGNDNSQPSQDRNGSDNLAEAKSQVLIRQSDPDQTDQIENNDSQSNGDEITVVSSEASAQASSINPDTYIDDHTLTQRSSDKSKDKEISIKPKPQSRVTDIDSDESEDSEIDQSLEDTIYSPDTSGEESLSPNVQNAPDNNNRQPSQDSNGSDDQIGNNGSQPNEDERTVVSANSLSRASISPDTSKPDDDTNTNKQYTDSLGTVESRFGNPESTQPDETNKVKGSENAEIKIKTESQPNQEDDNDNWTLDDSGETPETFAAAGTEDIRPNNILHPRIGTIIHPNKRNDESDILQRIQSPENINFNNPNDKNKPTINKGTNFLRIHDIPRHNIPISNGPWDQGNNGLSTYDTHPRHHLRPSQLNRHDNTRSIDTTDHPYHPHASANSPLVKTTSQPEAKQPTLHQTHHPRYRNTERETSNGLANFKDDNPKLLTEPQIGTNPQNPNGNTRPKNPNSKPQSDTSDISENDSYEPQDDEISLTEQSGEHVGNNDSQPNEDERTVVSANASSQLIRTLTSRNQKKYGTDLPQNYFGNRSPLSSKDKSHNHQPMALLKDQVNNGVLTKPVEYNILNNGNDNSNNRLPRPGGLGHHHIPPFPRVVYNFHDVLGLINEQSDENNNSGLEKSFVPVVFLE